MRARNVIWAAAAVAVAVAVIVLAFAGPAGGGTVAPRPLQVQEATWHVNWQPPWLRWQHAAAPSCVLLWPAASPHRAVRACQYGTVRLAVRAAPHLGVKPKWVRLRTVAGHCVIAWPAGFGRAWARLCRDGTVTIG